MGGPLSRSVADWTRVHFATDNGETEKAKLISLFAGTRRVTEIYIHNVNAYTLQRRVLLQLAAGRPPLYTVILNCVETNGKLREKTNSRNMAGRIDLAVAGQD